jgi:hypothetical protein
MPLTKCPACRKQLSADNASSCEHCGRDLVSLRSEIALLQRPSALWTGDTPVIPIAPLRLLNAVTRREILRVTNGALGSHRRTERADGVDGDDEGTWE